MCISLLELFFAMVLRIPSSISVAKLFTFAPFVFFRVFSVPLPRSEQLSFTLGSVFFALLTFLDVYFVKFNLLSLVVEFLPFFFGSFRACFFCVFMTLGWQGIACLFCLFRLPPCLFSCAGKQNAGKQHAGEQKQAGKIQTSKRKNRHNVRVRQETLD